jgi:DNA-binding transcriptional LysR family regulator
MDVEPRLLRYFLAVAEELHFGRAAARLYISQPSLSNQIRKLEDRLGTPLFLRTSRQVQLTAAGRTLLDAAPPALAALERAAEHTRLAGAGTAATLRLGYTPVAFDTLRNLLAIAEQNHPEMTVVAQEFFSAAIPERVLAGDLDIGLALHPSPVDGVSSELLRSEPVAALLSTRHRLADTEPIPLGELRQETLLLFPRQLAPAYYDRIVAACERAGFQPHVQAFEDPPVSAMLARLPGGREVGLIQASLALHAAEAQPGLVAREIADPAILAELSVLSPARDPSAASARFLDSARLCAAANGWLHAADAEAAAAVRQTP